jgi:AraC-like DNA-binding protein
LTGFLTTIILLGAIQGFIVSILLWRNKRNAPSNRLLSMLILLMALASSNIYFMHTGLFHTTTTLRVIAAVVPLIFIMPMGPLIYFYIQSCLDPAFTLTRKQAIHFYPVIIDIIPQLTAIIYLLGVWSGVFKVSKQPWGYFLDTYDVYSDIPRWVSLTVYIWLSARYIAARKAKSQAEDQAQINRFRWMQQFVYVFLGFQLIWLLYLVPYVIPRYTDWLLNTVDWYPVYIPMAIIIYWLGIKGYLVAQTASDNPEKKRKTFAADMPADTVQQTTGLLTKAMEQDKLYLNPALNLDLLSGHTGLPQKTISAVLNQHLGKSFNEWINEYRVAAFKQKIRQADMQHFTISGIAAECGFNSQATFQRIFKQSVGMTPSQYQKSLPLSA